jgi:hypothetical protein
MVPFTQIELVARRKTDVGEDHPDHLIYARDRPVGRIYCQLARPDAQQWFWGVQGVLTSMEIGQLHGLAEFRAGQDAAARRVRALAGVGGLHATVALVVCEDTERPAGSRRP